MTSHVLDVRKLIFLLKGVFMVNERFELTTYDPMSVDDVIC